MKKNGRYFVNGGRVLNVAAVAPTLKEAQDKAYEGVSKSAGGVCSTVMILPIKG